MDKSKHINKGKPDKLAEQPTNPVPRRKSIMIDEETKHRESQILKIKNLTDEITFIKNQLDLANLDNTADPQSTKEEIHKLKAEIHNLEVKIINQKSQLMRLEDKCDMLGRTLVNATHVLEKSHIDVMDAEELNYITESIENKKNDLLSARNFISEIQKIGYINMPVKVADECRKTYLELDYINSTTRKYKQQVDDAIAELKAKTKELEKTQNQYTDKKKVNNNIEISTDEIVNELEVLTKFIYSKENKARDLENVVKDFQSEITKAIEEQEKIKLKNQEDMNQILKEKEKQKLEKEKRNKEIDDLQLRTTKLQKTLNLREKKHKTLQNELKKMKNVTMDMTKYNLNELRSDYGALQADIQTLKESLVVETKLKMEYFNILEDMLGKAKTICRIRNGAPDSIVEVDVDQSVSLTTNKNKSFNFDHFFDPNSTNENIFSIIEYLYKLAFEGFNCYIVTIGGKQSGKSYTTIGQNENGLVWLGLNKIKELIKINKKDQITTRMFACGVEINNDVIFDLIDGSVNKKIEIKKDYFNMTLLSNATYKECFEEDELRKILKTVLQNRTQAATDLKSNDTTFVFLVTIQNYNKFIHRYTKGKITHVKLAGFDKINVLKSELKNLGKGLDMNYKQTKLTSLFRDCFGGSAKTCVIGQVNPSSGNETETLETLSLVSGMKNLINEITKNSEPEEVFKLKNDIERLLRGINCEYH